MTARIGEPRMSRPDPADQIIGAVAQYLTTANGAPVCSQILASLYGSAETRLAVIALGAEGYDIRLELCKGDPVRTDVCPGNLLPIDKHRAYRIVAKPAHHPGQMDLIAELELEYEEGIR